MKRSTLLAALTLGALACKADRLSMGAKEFDGGDTLPSSTGGAIVASGTGGAAGAAGSGGAGGAAGSGGAGGAAGSGSAARTGGAAGLGGVIPISFGGTGGTTLPPPVACGNGLLNVGEQCDDGNTTSGDGCSPLCQLEDNCLCPAPGQHCLCLSTCGNGILTSDETCDDGNTLGGDGCSADCSTVEIGWTCRVPGRRCTPLCGDGIITGGETCDDGNSQSGDGCASTCQLEPGADCPTPGQPCKLAVCGNGILEKTELCDCGADPSLLPSGCKAVNGLFYGDGKGCSNTCTKEPTCQDSSGTTQACTATCGDGNLDPGEECDDGNLLNGDGCSSSCKIESGFTCSTVTAQGSSACTQPGNAGQCLDLPVIYRDFQPENVVPGGHPDFFFLGTKMGGSQSPTTICVPNSAGPSKGNDSTARCWGIVDSNLLHGKPQPGSATTCACQFSDWNFPNAGHIPGTYTLAGNDSPLSDGNGGYLGGGSAGATVSVAGNAGTSAGTMMGVTAGTPGGPIWKGTTPAYKDANSFGQWFNDDGTVNKTFAGVLEMKSIGTNIYQYASAAHLAQGGFYPLDSLNPSQATLCNLSPYWNHGNGTPIWSPCTGDQYLFPPRVIQSDCPNQNPLTNGCWVTAVQGIKHDSYFTEEGHYYFVYDGSVGFSVRVFANDDLFLFINGKLVLDLGGVHQQLPGMVTITGNPGNATITEGGCLDSAGNITQICNPTSSMVAPKPVSPDDYRIRTLSLGLVSGLTYELALFGANRQPTDSNLQISLNGPTSKRSVCFPRCGDGVVAAGEECDCGDGTAAIPPGCSGPNSDTSYGGCTTRCKFAGFCGDGIVNGPEQCDVGKLNGDLTLGTNGCTVGCTKPHYCGDGILDPSLGEQCDLGSLNGRPGQPCDTRCMLILY